MGKSELFAYNRNESSRFFPTLGDLRSIIEGGGQKHHLPLREGVIDHDS